MIQGAYIDNNSYRDEWELYDVVFSFVNYYDSSLDPNALAVSGIFYTIQIKGNLQNAPNLYAIIKFKEEDDGSRLTVNSVDKCTKFKFQYLPSDWTWEKSQFYGLNEVKHEKK